MTLKMLLSIYTVVLAAFGIPFLVVPSVSMSLYGVPALDALETILVQDIGAAAIGLGVLCWAARTAEASKARDALILGVTVVNGLWALVAVLAGITDAANWLVWVDAAGFSLLTVLFIVTGRQAMSAATAGGGSSAGP
jgi:hypothetical protein